MKEQKIQLYIDEIYKQISKKSSSQILIPLFHNVIKFMYHCSVSSCRFQSKNALDSKYFFQVKAQYQGFLKKHTQQNSISSKQDKMLGYLLKSNSQMIINIHQNILNSNNQPKNIQKDYLNKQMRVQSTSLANKIESQQTNHSQSKKYKQNQYDFKISKLQRQQQSVDYNQKNFQKRNLNLNHKSSKTLLQFQRSSSTVQMLRAPQILLLNKGETPKLQHQIQRKFQIIVKTYESHRLDQAYSLLQQYKQLKNQYKIQQKHFSSISNIHKNPNQKGLIEQIQSQFSQMTKYYSQFNLQKYQFDKEENGMIMHYKTFDNQNLVATHIQGQVDISLERFLCIVFELNLCQNYVPFNYETLQLKILEKNRKIGVSRISLPLISNREYYFLVSIYDKLEQNGSVFVYSRKLSIEQAKIKYNYQIPKAKINELDFRFFLLEYKPISKTRGWLKMASCAGIQMIFLPNFIKNKTTRIFSFDYFQCILKVNKKFKGSQWQKAIHQRPQIYKCFRQKLEKYFEKNKERLSKIK